MAKIIKGIIPIRERVEMEIIVKKLSETEVAYIRRTESYFEPQYH
ncbi:hypothetical protein KIS4809_3626 [Bacillus sp. ZZV12-4809]|nr:hypothetical protein KIS4809_3626 [Bacillus sp. ZZV12-4809]